MAAPINFESCWEKDKEKEQLRDARKHALDKVNNDVEKRDFVTICYNQ